MYPIIEWQDNKVIMIDQRLLPLQEKFIEHSHYKQVAQSIKDMVIRGAPAIGVAAAMGTALGVINEQADYRNKFPKIIKTLAETRPTAVNLFWALKKMEQVFLKFKGNYQVLKKEMINLAIAIDREDLKINKNIGKNGQKLLKDGQIVLTHCNAGSLATAGYGTALGVIRAAWENNKKISVIADETRPFLQGARLTVWELQQDNIPVTLITDNMAGHIMSREKIDAVIVGADRIAANGDVANKIGTFSVAVLADFHNIPFYVAAPLSTIDTSLVSGAEIPIENRDPEEVTFFMGQRIARPGTNVLNPAFDITPNRLITAIITEKKVIYPAYTKEIAALF